MGHRVVFQLNNFVQPATMSLRAAEPGAEEVLRAVPGNRDAHGPPAEAEYVHVIIFHSLAGREVIVTERRACAGHLIGGYRSAHTAAAH